MGTNPTLLSALTGDNTTTEPHWCIVRLKLVTYDGLGYDGYLERMGTSLEALSQMITNMQHIDFIMSCYQELLFFALFDEFRSLCPEVLSVERFTSIGTDPSTEVVLFSTLSSMLRDVCKYQMDKVIPEEVVAEEENRQEYADCWSFVKDKTQEYRLNASLLPHARRLNWILRDACSTAKSFHTGIARHWLVDPSSRLKFNPDILLSLEMLFEGLEDIFKMIFGNDAASVSYQVRFPVTLWSTRTYLLSRGWCLSRIDALLLTPMGSANIRYYMSLLPSMDSRTHRACPRFGCLLTPNSREEFGQRHEQELFTCASRAIRRDVVEGMLRADTYPLIDACDEGVVARILRKGLRNHELRAVPAAEGSDYIAISHVWSHGLGNPIGNSLPSCQLKLLQVYISKLRSKFFWIDTLCVPATGTYKALGISKLRAVYTNASKVLIVDGRLAHLKVGNRFEAKMQFVCCEWFSRLWTLQEAWLASSLWVQFDNVALSVKSLLDAYVPLGNLLPGMTAPDWVLSQRLRPLMPTWTEDINLMHLQSAMWYRDVTESADEAICMATLLKLDFSLELPTLKDIFAQVWLPDGLLWSQGPRMKARGFRWAPTSLLNRLCNSNLLDYQERRDVKHTCYLTREGLRCCGMGFRIPGNLDLRFDEDDIKPLNRMQTEDDAPLIMVAIYDVENGRLHGFWRPRGLQHFGSGERPGLLKDACVLIGSLQTERGEDIMLGEAIFVENVVVRDGVYHGNYVVNALEVNSDIARDVASFRVIEVKGELMGRNDWCID